MSSPQAARRNVSFFSSGKGWGLEMGGWDGGEGWVGVSKLWKARVLKADSVQCRYLLSPDQLPRCGSTPGSASSLPIRWYTRIEGPQQGPLLYIQSQVPPAQSHWKDWGLGERKPRKDSSKVSGPENQQERENISGLIPGLGVSHGGIRVDGSETGVLVEDLKVLGASS